MPTCFDVAKYILEKKNELTTIKLQKLVYYSQAWSLVWDDAPLFQERIEAWINGPVIPDLYKAHKGLFTLSANQINGDSKNLTEIQKQTIDSILNYYGDQSSQWLSDLTHQEQPWLKARKNVPPNARGNSEITWADMAEYYSSLS